MARLKLCLIVSLRREPREEIEKVTTLGFPTCQVSCSDADLYSDDIAQKLRESAEDNDVEVTTIWAGLPGKHIWGFIDGPATIGLVPLDTRRMRLQALKKASDFACEAGVKSITTHVGFVPENPRDTIYVTLVDALKDVARFCRNNGQSFWFETGQETQSHFSG